MTYTDVKTMIAGIGIPYAYYQFTKNTAQPPPFICFYFTADDDLMADNTNYQKISELVVELYTEQKDFTQEQAVESALNGAGLAYRREEAAIASERLYLCSFYTTVVITEEETNGNN